MWQQESPEIRSQYKAKAEQKKAEHLLKHPGYCYRPRKPSEKKRRMSRKKALNAMLDSPTSLDATSQYASMAQETSSLVGDIGGVGSATLPLSAVAVDAVKVRNNLTAVTIAEAIASPVNVVPSTEYAAVQAADELALDLAFAPDHFESFMNYDVHLEDFYGDMDNMYQLYTTMYPNEAQN